MVSVRNQRGRNVGNGEHMIDPAGRNRVARHAIKTSLLRFLRDNEARPILDRFQSETAIRSSARQDNAHGAWTVVIGQRVQQVIEWQPRAMSRRRCNETQSAFGDR